MQQYATVIGASNSNLVGLNGRITDETRHMLVLHTKRGYRMIPKQKTMLHVGHQQVSGDMMRGRIYERLTNV